MDEKEAEKIVFAFEAAYSSAIRSKDAAALCALTVDDVIVQLAAREAHELIA